MMTATKQILPAFGALVLALLFVPNANAECGGFTKLSPTHTDWQPQAGSAHLVRAAFSATDDERPSASASVSIVGMWHVHFVAQGNSGIPDGTEIDAGYSQWHSDGTEIMNSGGRNPNTGAFCLGVWEKVGSQYKLNHFAAAWDPTAGTDGALLGPARIQETVTLGASGNTFAGSFTISQYNEAGALLAQVKGNITGTRMDVNTTAQPIF